MNFIIRNIKRLGFGFSGIFYALKTDFSYRTMFYGGGAFVTIASFFLWPLSDTELMFIVLSWTLVVITELQNSSFEAALDRIHPEMHDSIGKSKDMAAGAVLTASAFMLFVLGVIACNRIDLPLW